MIAPLVDIVFNLLIFFMLVTKYLSPSIAVALPQSGSGEMDESRARTVSIDRDGNTFIDNTPATLSEIARELEIARAAGEIDIVRLRADKDTRFQRIIDVLDVIRKSGIRDISVETEWISDEVASERSRAGEAQVP